MSKLVNEIIENVQQLNAPSQPVPYQPTMQDLIFKEIMSHMNTRKSFTKTNFKGYPQNEYAPKANLVTLSDRVDFHPDLNLNVSTSTLNAIESLLKREKRPHTTYEVEASFGAYNTNQPNFYPGIK